MTLEEQLKIQKLLTAKAHSYEELAKRTKLSYHAVARHLRKLRAVKGVLFIEAWDEDRTGRPFTPKFRWGTGKDAVKPAPLTAAQRMARTRQRRAEQ